jgi:hypothetical protein
VLCVCCKVENTGRGEVTRIVCEVSLDTAASGIGSYLHCRERQARTGIRSRQQRALLSPHL